MPGETGVSANEWSAVTVQRQRTRYPGQVILSTRAVLLRVLSSVSEARSLHVFLRPSAHVCVCAVEEDSLFGDTKQENLRNDS